MSTKWLGNYVNWKTAVYVFKGIEELPDKEKLKTQEKDKIIIQVKFMVVIAGDGLQISWIGAACLKQDEKLAYLRLK